MTMLNEVLAVVRDRLENALQFLYPQDDSWVVLSNIEHGGNANHQEFDNKIIISLVGLQQDSSTGSLARPHLGEDERYYTAFPPLLLDAYLMISANFTGANYEAGLSRLSRVIYYFQETPVLTRDSAPTLPANLDRLLIEFVSLDFAQMSHLLTAVGSKYLPSAVYRLRRLPFVGAPLAGVAPAVRSTGRGGGPA